MLALCAPLAHATVAAPGVYTGAASNVTSSSATLAGSVNPHGSPTSIVFQYGRSAAYEAQTQAIQLDPGTTSVHVAGAIAGLPAFTVYHFRVVATNSAGTKYGEDRVFTTKKIPLKFAPLDVEPRPVAFGGRFSVTGGLSGTGAQGHSVVLEGSPFPYVRSFRPIAGPVTTDLNGRFTFAVPTLFESTALRVSTGDPIPVHSPTQIQLVAVRVAFHVRSTSRRGFARLFGTVTPSQPGARVAFQLLRPGRRPLTIAGARLGDSARTGSRFTRVVRIRRRGLYRAYVQVLGGEQIAGHSRAISIG